MFKNNVLTNNCSNSLSHDRKEFSHSFALTAMTSDEYIVFKHTHSLFVCYILRLYFNLSWKHLGRF